MSSRRLFILTVLLVPAVAGCGDRPTARFVASDRTKSLDRPARLAVEGELTKSFGDPYHLVAWRKLPVDFGEFDGTVESAGQHITEPIHVRLVRKADSKVPIASEQLKGAALAWTSGSNADVVAQDAKGNELPIDFEVVQYDPTTSDLTLSVAPPAAASALSPPKPGDKFAVLGPVLQYGRKLYMTHCMHCHGVSGDGEGPTASYLQPRPRDYRLGLFKFTSTRRPDKARRDDLARTIRQGIPGTYMPSFLLFSDSELGAIVEYVRWLAMRGEFEDKSDVEFADQFSNDAVAQRVKGGEQRAQIEEELGNFIAKEYPRIVAERADELANAWTTSEQPESVVVPKKARTPDTPASRERGRKLYFSDTAKCATCHGPTGHGDGPQTEDYQTIPGKNQQYSEPGLFDDWGHAIRPRDLTSGIYRGGRRPLDIYRRVYSGIKGTPMLPFGTVLSDDQIWDLVNYVMSLPYQGGSPTPEPPQRNMASSLPDQLQSGGGN